MNLAARPSIIGAVLVSIARTAQTSSFIGGINADRRDSLASVMDVSRLGN